MKFEDSVLRTLKNYQIKPARTRVEINDKTVKVIFNIKEASYERSLKGGKTRIIEKRNHPKHGNIYAPYTIRNAEGYDDMKPLTEFERDVLSVCISECCNGTYFITPAIIFRALVGKVGEVGVVPSKDQKAAIVHAVEKLQKTKFNKIFAEAYDLLKPLEKTLCSLPKSLPPKSTGNLTRLFSLPENHRSFSTPTLKIKLFATMLISWTSPI